jgi:hypothetical protein
VRQEDAIMPFSLYAAVLSSQLIVTVADRIPEFDVGPTCRESTVHDCLNTEKIAREKLVEAWPHFTAQDKAACVMEERLAGPPSYVGWLTCLQINANARNVGADGSVEGATTGTGKSKGAGRGTPDGTSSGLHRRRTRH